MEKIQKPRSEALEKPKQREFDKGTKKIIRILATDIDGDMPIINALRRIRGISFMFANAVCNSLDIDKKRKLKDMGEEEIKSMENFINKPDMPSWLLNRRHDIETGNDMHITKTDIDMRKREDINILRRIRAYRGVRHEQGQPVRGQRTRSSFRTQKTVGVIKKNARQAPAKKPEKP
jgi:small subunit ribosomal protein S13